MDSIASLLEEHRKSILADFETTISALETKLDCIQATVSEHTQKIASLESNATLQDDFLLMLENTCARLAESHTKLQAKVLDLESHSHCNNNRVVGVR